MSHRALGTLAAHPCLTSTTGRRHDRSIADRAVDAFADQVGVTVVLAYSSIMCR